MHADLTKVRQSLFNLLSNACKFTENGTITLEASREPLGGVDWIKFSVSDTGIGMDPEQMEKLFQPFVQGDASTSRKFGGTGLGMTITHRFCAMMGGEITAKSEPGRGTTFTIRLPARVKVQPPAAAPLTEAPEPMAPDGSSTILVIEDDPNTRDLLKRFLSKDGFHVRTVAEGEEGLLLARELKPDVITLDVMMSGLDGWAVLTELKADPDLADIPVVMVTFVDNKNLGYALGASDYLTKPISASAPAGGSGKVSASSSTRSGSDRRRRSRYAEDSPAFAGERRVSGDRRRERARGPGTPGREPADVNLA